MVSELAGRLPGGGAREEAREQIRVSPRSRTRPWLTFAASWRQRGRCPERGTPGGGTPLLEVARIDAEITNEAAAVGSSFDRCRPRDPRGCHERAQYRAPRARVRLLRRRHCHERRIHRRLRRAERGSGRARGPVRAGRRRGAHLHVGRGSGSTWTLLCPSISTSAAHSS